MNKQIVAVKMKNLSNQWNNNQTEWSSKEYHFFSLEDVEIGDKVVVMTSLGLNIAKISRLLPESNYAKSYIVQKVDLEKHEERILELEKAESIKAKLANELNKQFQIDHYKEMAKNGETESIRSLAQQYVDLLV